MSDARTDLAASCPACVPAIPGDPHSAEMCSHGEGCILDEAFAARKAPAASRPRPKRLRIEFKRNDVAVLIYALEDVIEQYKANGDDPLIVDELRLRDRLEDRLRRFDRGTH